MAVKFFITAFAVSGDKTTVPNGVQTDGSVSYTQGYGPDYEANRLTDPAALLIERQKMNELFYDMTTNIQQYQIYGTPEFITTADNGGSAYSYSKDARVFYDDGGGRATWTSLVNSNIVLPGSDPTKWSKSNPGFALPPNANYGDITVSSAGTVWTINNLSVTNAKMATMATGTIKSNITGGTTSPSDNTITTVLDFLGSTQGTILYRNASGWVTLGPGTSGQSVVSRGPSTNPVFDTPVVRSYIAGLKVSTAGSSATVTIAPGQAADTTNAVMITLAASLNKTTSAWAVGSGNGSLDEGTIANSKWYRHYLIRRPDTGVVDELCSLAPNTSSTITVTIASPGVVTWTAHGLQVGAGVVFTTTGALPTGITAGTRYYVSTVVSPDTFQISATIGGGAVNTTGSQSGVHTATSAPALPTNYTQYRDIGSWKTDGSAQWVAVLQDGPYFRLLTSILDVTTTNPGTSAVLRNLASVPTGINVFAIFNASIYDTASAGYAAYISDPGVVDQTPSLTLAPLINLGTSIAANSPASAQLTIRTDTSGRVRTRSPTSAATTTFEIATLGWTDNRGAQS